jgi:hypothetical protein
MKASEGRGTRPFQPHDVENLQPYDVLRGRTATPFSEFRPEAPQHAIHHREAYKPDIPQNLAAKPLRSGSDMP